MPKSDAAFKKRLLLKCCDALERKGFTRFRKDGVDWPIHDGFHGWAGLNTGLYRDRVELNPFVGVHVVPLEQLWTSLTSGTHAVKYGRGVATYAIHLGQLDAAGGERAFVFRPEQDEKIIDVECERLAQLYATVGLQYARSIGSYEALLPLLERRVASLGGFPERYACCLYLMGRGADARTFIEAFSKKYPEFLADFTRSFLALLESEAVSGSSTAP